ncbi:hypothetical protein [Bradyrhizobium sp. CSS354]|uniref:hypothetical protein n=1 Tax=Bradyrhizobium sp. CSS354 TaxID=2699172 RepID=UPI0023AFD5A1|nr:hypothetical protein [Bradyrhizobium sp. CSS354]
MNRREVLALLGVTAALPASVLAQTNATRRLGVLSVTAADDAIGQTRSAVLVQALAGHGWKERDNSRSIGQRRRRPRTDRAIRR